MWRWSGESKRMSLEFNVLFKVKSRTLTETEANWKWEQEEVEEEEAEAKCAHLCEDCCVDKMSDHEDWTMNYLTMMDITIWL